MKKAVMYGGGNIGRGFIGATLSQSGYKVTFIDVAEPVVKALQEKEQYPVRYVSSEEHEDVVIEHVTAVNGNDQEAASEAIANCDIMATAVGARILKFIVGNIVAGLRKRWARDDRPLNIIICENLMDANKVMEGMLKDLLTDEEKEKMCDIVCEAGADYIKTSTGFSTAGATFHDVELMVKGVHGRCKVKAAGGISTVEDMEKFLALGADRLGTSRAVKLLNGEQAKGY